MQSPNPYHADNDNIIIQPALLYDSLSLIDPRIMIISKYYIVTIWIYQNLDELWIILEEVKFSSCLSLDRNSSETAFESAESADIKSELGNINADAEQLYDNMNLKVGSYLKRKEKWLKLK